MSIFCFFEGVLEEAKFFGLTSLMEILEEVIEVWFIIDFKKIVTVYIGVYPGIKDPCNNEYSFKNFKFDTLFSIKTKRIWTLIFIFSL